MVEVFSILLDRDFININGLGSVTGEALIVGLGGRSYELS